MASNSVRSGEVLPVALPYNRTSGQAFKVGVLFAVALVTGTTGDVVSAATEGEWEITCLATDTCATVGIPLYWDDTQKRLTTTASTHLLVGYSSRVKANGEATAGIKLTPKGA